MNLSKLVSKALKVMAVMAGVLFVIHPLSGFAGDESSSGRVIIKFNKADNTLSADLLNAEISDVAETLSEKAGIKIFLDDTLDRKITSTFENMPIEHGIKRLLGSGISSAFVFTKAKGPSGTPMFRVESVRIFRSGNMMTNFRAYDNKGMQSDSKGSVPEAGGTSSGTRKQNRGARASYASKTPGAIAHDITTARQRLDEFRKRNQTELNQAKQKIAELKMRLSRTRSPQARARLISELGRAENRLTRLKTSGSRGIIDGERNIRDLLNDQAAAERQRQFTERMRESERQRALREKSSHP